MVQRPKFRDFSQDDYLDSDDEGVMYTNAGDSSDDEEGNLSSLRRNSITGNNSGESGNEFEKEMAAELLTTMKMLTTPIKKKGITDSTGQSTSKENDNGTSDKEEKEFYDDVYFDSDDSEGEKYSTRKPQPKRKMMTDEELFYDPDMDDEDQKWVDGARRKCQLKQQRLKGQGDPQKLPNSDAVLNCPACFTTLCMDCQRHEIYNHQYRAMFVFNCKIDFVERLKFPKKVDKKELRKLRRQKGKSSKTSALKNVPNDKKEGASNSSKLVSFANSNENIPSAVHNADSEIDSSIKEDQLLLENSSSQEKDSAVEGACALVKENEMDSEVSRSDSGDIKDSFDIGSMSFNAEGSDDIFHPVKCEVCNTKVAVYDADEVYHFFSVLASY